MFFKKAPSGAVPAPPPKNERARLEALRSYDIMDTLPERAYDDLVQIAAAICQTPVALMGLIDDRRQWFKSVIGLGGTETPRDLTFCGHTILDTKVMVVNDALKDPRFETNPMVLGEPKVRFYAGVPIVDADGNALGTVCAVDTRPREIDQQQRNALEALARQIMSQLELRRTLARMQKALDDGERVEPAPTTSRSPQSAHDRATEALAQSDEMRRSIRDLLGLVDAKKTTR